ncbi:ABC transporter ATP-binding protein [Gryllotalpicola protaetiae]|uniref:ABC transporter ATP-binding protein n=1 Tax=Gryllotalpicola protaetiae TaxID=2419771 RepID=A0A387BQX6_9MICO|nr:ABC transporter ATP-binding protein [Gryllotalpicola protaetiae]AYG03387.1 ABC transporter ATP-binding protein [Gryllotalpicola protaetiae]
MTEQKPVSWVARLWSYVLRHRTGLYIALGAALLGSGCQVLTPLVARQIVDTVIGHHQGSLWVWLGVLLALAAANFVFAHLRRYRGGKVALEVQNDLRNDMHDHLQSMDFTNLDRMPTGQLVARASSDSGLVMMLLNFLPVVSGNVVLLVLSLVVMFVLSPLLALVGIAIIPALIFVSYRMRSRVFPATWDAQQREGELVQIVDEDTGGVRVVKAFGQERRELRRLTDAATKLYGAQMRSTRIQSRFQPLLESIPAFGQVGILALGGWLALNGNITLGTFLAFSTYVAQMLAPARQLAGMLAIAQQARAGVERIAQLLDTPPAIADAPDAVVLAAPERGAAAATDTARGATVSSSIAHGAVEFDDVHFAYGDDARRRSDEHSTLTGFSLRVAAGERVALVGASGSGKSTAAMLIPRFYDPARGAVRVDGIDVRRLTLHSLRSQIGVVFEESFLFSDSVRSNIAYGRPEASDAEIERAARIAQADGFIAALPRGYDTVVGERGLSLSGGQRQRVALARAILADPRILILDDATSAIDARTEEAIHDGLREVLADRTVVLIAHRQSTLHLADRVVLVDGGRVVDEGTHDELMARNAAYRVLLSGMEDGETAAGSAAATGDIDSVAAYGKVTSGAWRRPEAADASTYGARSAVPAAPSLGPGLGGTGGGGMVRRALAATPELIARVEKLPPVKDFPEVDIDREGAHRPHFSLRSLLADYKWPLLFGLLFVVVDAVAGLLGPVLVKNGIDQGVVTGSTAAILAASALFLLVTLVDLFDQIAETFVMGRTAQRVMLSLRVRVFAQLQRLSLDYYEREMAGRIMTRMTTDIDQFEQLVENGLLAALVAFVTFVGVGVAILIVNPLLGGAVLVVIIPLAIATVIFRRRAAVLYEQARDRIAIVNADFQESLSGVHEAQAFVHEGATKAHFHRLGGSYLEARVAAQKLVATYFPFVQFLSSVADAIVLGLGAWLIVNGHFTTGALIAFLLYVDMFFSPIQQLSQVFDAWQQTTVSVRRIAGLMALDSLTPEAQSPVSPGRLSGTLTLEDVHFAYPAVTARPGVQERGPQDARLATPVEASVSKPPEALRGVSLDIAAGETVALVGETGAGKSTVMKLLARFYDVDRGTVRVDGHDVRSLALGAYRAQLGYVPQEAFLFTGTVRDNIAYGRPEATDAAVEAAARAVGAHDFIAALPNGYLQEITERGRSLSAGQRQLIALARAQLVDPAILLLDEATSNLDLAAEARVTAAMERVASGRTTVLIAHRLQTARTADRIVVLGGGGVLEVGSHDELLAADGSYASMWRAFELASERA